MESVDPRKLAIRYLEAKEFSNDKALKDYLRDHPNANPRNHTVAPRPQPGPAKPSFKELAKKPKEVTDSPKKAPEKGPEKPEGKEEKSKPEGPKKSWSERLKSMGSSVKEFISSAPKQVQKFISDEKFRKKTIQGAVSSLKSAPAKIVSRVVATAKDEIHEFKSAGEGVASLLKGGKMSGHQKKALKAVGTHLAIGFAAAALTASGPLAAAGVFAKGLVKHIAMKSVAKGMEKIHLFQEMGHIGHGVHRFFTHMASDDAAMGVLRTAGKDADPEDVMANFFLAAVAKEMDDLSDEDIEKILVGMGKKDENEEEEDDDDDEDDGKEASLRSSLIRLAHDNEALRPQLLPILTREAAKGPLGSDDLVRGLKDILSDLDQVQESLLDLRKGTSVGGAGWGMLDRILTQLGKVISSTVVAKDDIDSGNFRGYL